VLLPSVAWYENADVTLRSVALYEVALYEKADVMLPSVASATSASATSIVVSRSSVRGPATSVGLDVRTRRGVGRKRGARRRLDHVAGAVLSLALNGPASFLVSLLNSKATSK
jgi:hypothetical protein